MASQQAIDALEKQLQQLQLQQETDQADQEALSRVTLRLCLAAKGLDRDLDPRLEAFQEQLKGNASGSLMTKAESTEKALMGYFHRRDQSVSQSLEALRSMMTLLWDNSDSEALKGEIDHLLADLPEQVEHYGDYPQLLSETTRILKLMIGQFSAKAGDGEESESELSEQLELLNSQIGSKLLELIGQLSIPTSDRNAARKLITTIEKGTDWQQLPALIEATVELVLKAMVVGQEEFEDYLSSLNNQLADIQGFLVESRDDQKAHLSSSEQLDKVVRTDVANMEASLTKVESLDQLKSSVRSQLADIVQAMDHYRAEQSQREQKVEARLQQLQHKLETMEEQSDRMQLHLEEQRMRAVSDPLTMLPNRAAYNDRVEQEFSRYQRYRGDLTIVVGDIDHFKRINDNYGHLAGDKVLRLVAKQLASRLRDTDFIARYGGEEFVILMPETGQDKAKAVIESLREGVAASPFNFGGEPVQITASFGLTQFRLSDERHETTFGRADDALYQAKRQGRNRSIIAS